MTVYGNPEIAPVNSHVPSSNRFVLTVWRMWFLLENSACIQADRYTDNLSLPSCIKFSLFHSFILNCLRRWKRVFRNVGIYNSDSDELPRRKHTSRNKYFEFIIFDTSIYSFILLKKWINYIQVKYMENSKEISSFTFRIIRFLEVLNCIYTLTLKI